MIKNILVSLLVAIAGVAHAAGGGVAWDRFPTEKLSDRAALQNGAKLFVNYCLNCHSAAFMRFNRLQDIGISEQQIKDNLLFVSDKVGDTMKSPIDDLPLRSMVTICSALASSSQCTTCLSSGSEPACSRTISAGGAPLRAPSMAVRIFGSISFPLERRKAIPVRGRLARGGLLLRLADPHFGHFDPPPQRPITLPAQ